MRNILFILKIFIAIQCIITEKEIVPVFVLDYSRALDHLTAEPNPFYIISSASFANILREAKRRSDIVIFFTEDQFSVEDISSKDKKGTSYYNLHLGLLDNKVKYLPRVIDPFKQLSQIFQPQQRNIFHISTNTKLPILKGDFKHFYVFFRDNKNETRSKALRRHDLIMRDVYLAMRQLTRGPVIAFYTGKINPVRIEAVEYVPIAPVAASTYPGVVVVTDGALFRLVGVFSVIQARRALFNQIPIVAEETWTSGSLTTRMAYTNFELEFNFSFNDVEWKLESVALLEGGEEVGQTATAAAAPWDWAYYCGEPVVLINTRDGSSVSISEYKIQPLRERRSHKRSKSKKNADRFKLTFNPVTNQSEPLEDDDSQEEATTAESESKDPEGFGNTVYCEPYFSAGILAGLLIVGLCLGILSFGLIAISNCTSNDRYEDPHGKLLVLGVER